ncbi:MAG: hypothetical protein E7678_02755 [Ruminococcaceae bacterium]|nr:hypothetical protein [Oscillospiraceae bacterium]
MGMKTQSTSKLIAAILMTVLGIMFIILKGDVISIGMTVLGIMLIVQAVLDIFSKKYVSVVIKAVIGILIIVMGWLFVTVALYIMAAVLLIYAILQLFDVIRALPKLKTVLAKVVGFIQPAVYLAISLCLLFNQGGTISVVFIIAGIFLIIQGVLALLDCLATRK